MAQSDNIEILCEEEETVVKVTPGNVETRVRFVTDGGLEFVVTSWTEGVLNVSVKEGLRLALHPSGYGNNEIDIVAEKRNEPAYSATL